MDNKSETTPVSQTRIAHHNIRSVGQFNEGGKLKLQKIIDKWEDRIKSKIEKMFEDRKEARVRYLKRNLIIVAARFLIQK